jgi:hypothetical protein
MRSDIEPRIGKLGVAGTPALRLGVLYVGLPLAIALLFTLMRSGLAALMPFERGLLVWTLLVLPAWWGAQAMTALAHRVLRPWTPPLWALCIAGSIGQALVLSPYYRAVFEWSESLATSGRLHGEFPPPELTLVYVATLLWSIAPGATVWTIANYVYDRVLGVPRFRYPAARGQDAAETSVDSATAAAVSESAAPPPLLARSRLPATAEIRAITAEEHYVRIYTSAGTDLVRYRFSDALAELGPVRAGMQVHRSWWVRMDRVASWHDRGRSCELELADGLRVPVSLAFREAVLARIPPEVRDRARAHARDRRARPDGTGA